MPQAKRSFLGLAISLFVHALIVGSLFWSWHKPSESANSAPGELSTAISMEMLQGMVMEEPAPEPEKAQPEPEPEKQDVVEDPTKKPEPKKIKEPEKPKDKPKPIEKPKEKTKEKPKKEVVKPQDKPINRDLPKGDKNIDSSANVNAKATTTALTNSNGQVAGAGSDNSEIAAYRTAIRREIERHKRYPARAKMMRKQGRVGISFSVAADGALTNERVVQSSGDESLDNAALEAVKNAKPVGTRPAGFPLGLNVPISFTLQ